MGDTWTLVVTMLTSMGIVAAISVPMGAVAWLVLVVLDFLVSIEPWVPAPVPALAIAAPLRRGPVERCAYCLDYLLPSERGLGCAECRTELHAGCWGESLRCPTLGCRGRGPRL